MKERVVIIGASIAGINVMNKLIKENFEGEIIIFDQNGTFPYNPYKLTKDWMLDLENTTPPLLKKESFYQRNNVDLRLNTKIVDFDPESQTILTHNNDVIKYDKLVIATGSKLNKLDVTANNLMYLRSFSSALKIKKTVQNINNITIIGAGFIGLELAASLSQLNKNVNVIFRHNLPLEKTLGTKTSEHIFNLLKSNGVNFIQNDSIDEFNILNNKIISFTTKNELKIETDLVIGAIGVKPNIPFTHPNLKVDKAILVDKYHRTSIPHVYAAGDNTIFPYNNSMIHLEHWESAYFSGINVAKNILNNNNTPYEVIPYFWTDLYDETFEYLGYANSFEYAYYRESDDPKKFIVAYTDKDNNLLAILFTNKVVKRKVMEEYFKNTQKINPHEFTNPNYNIFDE